MIEITTNNCNYHLTRLYKERDQIGAGIDRAIISGNQDTVAKLEKEYDEKCDLISKFIAFMNNHECLLEGDPGYGPI